MPKKKTAYEKKLEGNRKKVPIPPDYELDELPVMLPEVFREEDDAGIIKKAQEIWTKKAESFERAGLLNGITADLFTNLCFLEAKLRHIITLQIKNTSFLQETKYIDPTGAESKKFTEDPWSQMFRRDLAKYMELCKFFGINPVRMAELKAWRDRGKKSEKGHLLT